MTACIGRGIFIGVCEHEPCSKTRLFFRKTSLPFGWYMSKIDLVMLPGVPFAISLTIIIPCDINVLLFSVGG